MTRISQLAYRMGQAHGVLGYGAIPGADIPTALIQKYLPKAWPYARGLSSALVRRASPYAMGASLALQWKTSGGMERFIDNTLQRGHTGSHWENTPKQRFTARKTHGFLVSPKDRMIRNAPLESSFALARRERARFS